jgi:hypothetical protein
MKVKAKHIRKWAKGNNQDLAKFSQHWMKHFDTENPVSELLGISPLTALLNNVSENAQDFMDALSILSESEYIADSEMFIYEDRADKHWWCVPVGSVERVCEHILKDLAKGVAELQEIPWRKQEAEAARAKFKETHRILSGIGEIQQDYRSYFPMKVIRVQGVRG